MAKRKKNQALCPSCNTPMHRTEITVVLSAMQKNERSEYKHYNELKMDSYDSFLESNFEWACDSCLSSKKAILANSNLQNYSSYPHLAYFDSKCNCRNCKTDFFFDKEEKKYWYENLKFWIDASPINCKGCRKELRLLRIENKTLSEILKKNLAQISNKELMVVIDIYTKWGKTDKVKYYESLHRKR